MICNFFRNRVKWEFDIFSDEMLMQSKESIFALSDMITFKKRIYQILTNESFSEKEMKFLLSCDNMLDYIYMKVSSQRLKENSLSYEIHKQIKDGNV